MERRTRTTHTFDPIGEDGELPASFVLRRRIEHQARRSEREHWQADTGAGAETVQLIDLGAFSRQQLAELIADGAACLAWNGKNG